MSFNTSSSAGNNVSCVQFEPVSDFIVEEDEVLTFVAVARSTRNVFIDGESTFTVVITDDDGNSFVMQWANLFPNHRSQYIAVCLY